MWTEHVLNPQLIPSIFKGEPPSFDEVELRKLTVSFGEDIICELVFDLKGFPDGLPIKWMEKGYNTIQFIVSFIGSEISLISGLCGALVGNLVITYQEEKFSISFNSADTNEYLNFTAKWVNLNKITAYVKS